MSYQRNPNLRFQSKSYPLPWAWNWHVGASGNGTGETWPEPAWQKQQIEAGKRIVPSIVLNGGNYEDPWSQWSAYATPGFEVARDYGLPVILRGNNLFYDIGSVTALRTNVDPYDPDNHPWYVKDTDPPSTSDNLISLYSPLSGEWAERYGYIVATCPIVQNAISIYPTPPLVLFMDNNESGFEWENQENVGQYDVREPQFVKDVRNWYTTNIGNYSGAAADAITNRYNALMKTRFNDMEKWLKYKWQIGLHRGLREQSKHWDAVSYYLPYGGAGMNIFNGDAYNMWDDYASEPNFNLSVGFRSWAVHGGQGGKTGESYFNNWYDEYSTGTRVWETSSNQAWTRRVHSYTYAINPPASYCLTWQGGQYLAQTNRTPPYVDKHWRSYVTMTAWLHRSNLVGHYRGSGDPNGNWSEPYYFEVADVCAEAAKPTLIDFWRYGELAESLEQNPDIVYDSTHFDWQTTEGWQFQHVATTNYNRYNSTARSDPIYSSSSSATDLRRYFSQLGRNVDRLRTTIKDTTIWRRACFAIELDGSYAIYSWSTQETDYGNDDVWLPVGDVIHVVSCPFDQVGKWTIYNSATQVATLYDPSTEKPVPWRPWKDTSAVLDTQRKAELDARKQHIADVIAYTQSTAAATPQPLSAGDQSVADTAKQESTNYINYISQGS